MSTDGTSKPGSQRAAGRGRSDGRSDGRVDGHDDGRSDPSFFTLDEHALEAALAGTALAPWVDALTAAVRDRGSALRHGKLPEWRAALATLPARRHAAGEATPPSPADARRFEIIDGRVCAVNPLPDDTSREALRLALETLRPWRKGPFRVAGIDIDCEWRSDFKWARVQPHVQPLAGRTVLDVGCGSGYHLWCMRAAGAACALGIDPGLLFVTQFEALQRAIGDSAVQLLPLTLDTLPRPMQAFDTVFSMGVLYHRREHQAHLSELVDALRPGGELVLETLVSDSTGDDAIELDGRYARMRNIWCLPGTARVQRWLNEAGFRRVRCVSIDITDTAEQRTTHWMPYESLADALDAGSPDLTVEGHPRPRRAIFIAER